MKVSANSLYVYLQGKLKRCTRASPSAAEEEFLNKETYSLFAGKFGLLSILQVYLQIAAASFHSLLIRTVFNCPNIYRTKTSRSTIKNTMRCDTMQWVRYRYIKRPKYCDDWSITIRYGSQSTKKSMDNEPFHLIIVIKYWITAGHL